MSKQSAPRTHPDPPARRLRSLLAGASSLEVQTGRCRADVVARHTVGADGRLRIDLPLDSRIATDVRRQEEVPAVVTATDLVPTAVRDRVRGRAVLSGWLSPERVGGAGVPDLTVVLDLATAELSTAEGDLTVDPDEFAAAEPDPLADEEAELLCHLDSHHRGTVEHLCRLVDPGHLDGARRVAPIRLDRHGLVLRLEHAARHHDVRLAFTPVLRRPDELGERLDALLHRAGGCRPHGHP